MNVNRRHRAAAGCRQLRSTELLGIECPAKATCIAREWKGACASEWTTQSRCSAREHGDRPNPAAVEARAQRLSCVASNQRSHSCDLSGARVRVSTGWPSGRMIAMLELLELSCAGAGRVVCLTERLTGSCLLAEARVVCGGGPSGGDMGSCSSAQSCISLSSTCTCASECSGSLTPPHESPSLWARRVGDSFGDPGQSARQLCEPAACGARLITSHSPLHHTDECSY